MVGVYQNFIEIMVEQHGCKSIRTSSGLYRDDVSETLETFVHVHVYVLFEAVGLPEQFDTFLLEIGQKMRQCGPKNYLRAGARRGVFSKMVLLKFYLF